MTSPIFIISHQQKLLTSRSMLLEFADPHDRDTASTTIVPRGTEYTELVGIKVPSNTAG